MGPYFGCRGSLLGPYFLKCLVPTGSQLRQGRVSEPQLGEGTQQSPPPAFHSWNSKNISSLYFKTSDTDIKIHQHITMFQLEGICCISRQRSSGVFPRAAQYASPIGKDENPSTLFGLVWCYWPLGIDCCVRHRSTNFQKMNNCPGFQQSLILWQGFNLGSSSSLDSSEKLQLTDTVWFGVTDAMRFSQSLLFWKPWNFLIAAGQTSTCDWWERPAAMSQ